jgi:hypothetical protein
VTSPDWIVVTLKVIEIFDKLGIPYVVCGSVASIIHGTPRTTLDADLVADVKLEHVAPLASALRDDFYVEPDSIEEAIKSHKSFNLIHQETMFKVDVFVPKLRPFDIAQLAHRVEVEVASDPRRVAWIVSAEDIVLAKLEWFRIGDEVSERQWRDILGVLKTQLGRLDVEYMQQMAITLNVSDLLQQALEEAAK